MRLLSVAVAAMVAALALAASASAALWIDLDQAVARPGQAVHGKAVSPCALCGPRPLYLVDFKHSGLQLLKRVPRKGDPHYMPVGRFTWKQGGRFSFKVPNVRPGVYQLHALYRNGSAWTLGPASTMLRVLAFSPRRVSFGNYRIVVPAGWHWRTLRGPEQSGPRIAQLSNASFHVRPGPDPIKDMGRGTFVLTILPLGKYGSATVPTFERRDFLERSDPSRPRGHALARHSYCSPGGRCFSIQFEYGSERVPSSVLASLNGVLRSLRAASVRRAAGLSYPLLVNVHGLRVYGPPERPNVPCPRPLALPLRTLRTVRRAVALAMPPLFARAHRLHGGTKIDARDPVVTDGLATRSGYAPVAGGCGAAVWRRSIVAVVRLPHVVFSASLSWHIFAVARIRKGWVLWAMIH